jgi:hypothetical protein
MGVMRFVVHSPHVLEQWPEIYRAYISGVDGRVFPTRIEVDGGLVTCRRPVADSGRFNVAMPVPGFGVPMVSTASLPEREEPYLLPLELARGKIAQLRDQVAAWEVAGMILPEALRDPARQAHQFFNRATSCQDQPGQASGLAQESLRWAFQAAEIATRSYSLQRLAARRKRSPHLPLAMGCYLAGFDPSAPGGAAFVEAFSSAVVGVGWNHVEPIEGQYRWELPDAQVDWCLANRLLIYGGPLLDFSEGGFPPWLSTWEKDFPNLQSFVCDYVETAVGRYAGRIRHWDVCARANSGGALGLAEEERLALVARTLDVVRQVDDDIQLMIRIDQPWGEYQARGQHRLSPLQFVDALLRSGIGLSAVNLELAVGFRPGGSPSRDVFEVSRMLDAWTGLGIPLHVTLACPAQTHLDDAQADSAVQVEPDRWKFPWDDDAQAAWIDEHLPLLMAKQAVVGIFWAHFSDQAPHRFPHAGLLRADGSRRPALQHFIDQRRLNGKSDGDE